MYVLVIIDLLRDCFGTRYTCNITIDLLRDCFGVHILSNALDLLRDCFGTVVYSLNQSVC